MKKYKFDNHPSRINIFYSYMLQSFISNQINTTQNKTPQRSILGPALKIFILPLKYIVIKYAVKHREIMLKSSFNT